MARAAPAPDQGKARAIRALLGGSLGSDSLEGESLGSDSLEGESLGSNSLERALERA